MNLSKKKNIVFSAIFGLSFIIGLVFLIMPYTSRKQDGLEKVSDDTMGFLKKDDFKPSTTIPLKDYTIPQYKTKI